MPELEIWSRGNDAVGRLGNIQQTGAAPAYYLPSSSYDYGVGAFLLAGAQIVDLPVHGDQGRRRSHSE